MIQRDSLTGVCWVAKLLFAKGMMAICEGDRSSFREVMKSSKFPGPQNCELNQQVLKVVIPSNAY